MQFSQSYFEDEVRDGFYIPAMMKRAWAAQLEVLEDVEKICKRHNLHYQADFGTLIGAIRHGGFIPWDDDMDISMLRKDYDIFNQVALEELPEGYGILNFDHSQDGNFSSYLTRIYNGRRVRIDRAFLKKFHGFPFTAGLDIFPMDFVPPTAEEDELLLSKMRTLFLAADMQEGKEREECLRTIEREYNIKLDRSKPIKRQLFQNIENMCREYTGEGSEYIANMASRLIWGYREPIKYYADTIRIPFEEGDIEVPASYDAAMLYKTSQYMTPMRYNEGHSYPFYRRQEKELNTPLSLFQKYIFRESDLKREDEKGKEEQKGLKIHAKEMLLLFEAVRENVVLEIRQGNSGFAMELLESCQEGAIALGNRIEEAKGSNCAAVSVLEQFCEILYTVHEMIRQENVNVNAVDKLLKDILARLSDSIQRNVIERRVVVFLPYKAALWDSMESIWQAAVADVSCDVYVIPLPYCIKEFDGTLGQICYEGEQFPDGVTVIGYESFDFALQHPDMIFIQNPYDEYNIATTVPTAFYAKKLRKYTDKLIYIPWFVIDEIEEDDMRGNISMDYFCTMPGVVCADYVIVQSEKMREAYIRKLSEFAGENTRKVWEKKIMGLGSPKCDKEREKRNAIEMPEKWRKVFFKSDGSRKPVILYNTVPEAVIERENAMLDKIKNTLEVLEAQKEEIGLVWCANLEKSTYVREMQPALWEKYQRIVKEYCEAEWGVCCNMLKDDERAAALKFCDGYYGDADSSIRLCRQNGMPAIIQHVSVLYDVQSNLETVLSDDLDDNRDVYQELKEKVVRENSHRTLMKLEQFLMYERAEIQAQKESDKTIGEIIFETLK